MNRKLLLLLAGITLTFSSATFASNVHAGTNHPTVMEKLTDLKNSLTDTAKTGIEKFTEKASDIYSTLSTQIDEMFHNSNDAKDTKIASLKQERDELKKDLDNFNQTDDVKTEEMRRNLVLKLEKLNEKISDYNKSLKK